MKRIKAFTLLELTIVMVITSFIVVAGYFAYTSSIQRLFIFETGTKSKVDLTDLNLLLVKDFEECSSASLTKVRELTLAKNNSESLIYLFGEERVFRKTSTHIDTFNVKIAQTNSSELEQNRYYITWLSLSVESGRKNLALTYFKKYDPYFLMNLSE